MKVLLLNGSPHKEGCTYTALCEVEKTLNEAGIETEIFWIETKPLMSCTACLKCREKGECTFNKDKVNEFVKKAYDADGFIFGSPVHYAAATGAITSFWEGHSIQIQNLSLLNLQPWSALQEGEEQPQLSISSTSSWESHRCR